MAQGIPEMFSFGWKLELIAPDWMDNQLAAVEKASITDLNVDERKALYAGL